MTRRLVAVAAGLLLPLAFAPFNLFWLAPISVAGLTLVWERQAPREGAVLGMLYGFAAFSFGTYWLYISLRELGGAPIPVVGLLMLSLFAAMGCFFALKGWLVAKWAPQSGPLRWLLFVPATWVLVEWARGWVLTGFPWLSLGYSQTDTVLSAWAPLFGMHGVSLCVALLAGLAVTVIQGTKRAGMMAALAGFVIIGVSWQLASLRWSQPREQALRISMVQAAIPQELKWVLSEREPTLNYYRDTTLALEDQDLVIWPEAAIPGLPYEVMDFLEEMDKALLERNTQLFSGILTFDTERGEYRNTLMGLGPELGVYYKRHLVPFGEYFPVPGFITQWLRLMNLPSEDIAPGPDEQAPLYAGDVPVAPTICYEIAFGAEQLKFFPEAELLVNVSNDTWFGDSIAPHQHLQMAQMRSIETARPMLRATNTGITAIINADGRIVQRIPQFLPGVLSGEVFPHRGATPYVGWGNYPVVLAALLLALAAIFLPRLKTTV